MKNTATGGSASTPFRWSRIALAVVGLALAGTGLTGVSAPAGASGKVDDGSDWGSQGTLSSDSAITVRWDNGGNPASSIVPRDGGQRIPHTKDPDTGALRTYDDIKASVTQPYVDYFKDLSVTVSQTQDLVNQSVSIDISGVKADRVTAGALESRASFQVFQCWGGLTDTGKPDPGAANPDPATCQFGAGGPDVTVGRSREERRILDDTLAVGGDWQEHYNKGWVPFTAITGRSVDGEEGKNPFFDRNMTNEFSNISVTSAGTAQRQFEMQTTVESYGLGCGKRSDAASTGSCWLVVVPRVVDVLPSTGAISPSVWAQRLQVKLDFRKISVGCPGGTSRTLIGGSEMLTNAAESWVPGVCGARDIALGYSQLGDPVGRSQYVAGQNAAILTSERPDKAAVPVPVALAAPTVAYQLTYQPACAQNAPTTDEGATQCGYDDLAALRADHARAGTPVRDLKLDARLVAKLLTQSYYLSILDDSVRLPLPAWGTRKRPKFLLDDPEFKRLNPQLRHMASNAGDRTDHLILEAMRSDAATRVWQWLLSDPDARAFLNGCPDPDGLTVNPFYSTRTYVGCEDDKDALERQADADREATKKSSAYVDGAVSYPPAGSPYPMPTWQEIPPILGAGGEVTKSAYTLTDLMPRVDSMPASGREVGRGHIPVNSLLGWCPTNEDETCQPAPGKYKADKKRQNPAELNLLAITDTASAARWRVPTAQLCSSDGGQCVGADVGSLRKAADRFTKDDAGWYVAGGTDLASGAYPLTLPVYAAIDPTLPLADRKVYADALDFVTTRGQVPGFEAGELPPGYAPLSETLRTQARAGIAELRKAVPVVVDPNDDDEGDDPGSTPAVADPAPEVDPAGGPKAGATDAPGPATSTDQIMTVSASTDTWDWWVVPLGFSLALVAGLAGPVMRLRGRFAVGR
ncbi:MULTISPECIES: hypothetical protein [unclassified Nocardioides]|uniref:hypothetical protein n=1 Tax=unclassified Nocardioides TaxID=2615069 RepID=UPI0007024856|nr:MULTISPECIES: hypothetical protein [unclassified Nocardioides]KRC59501.1 hypothetical protein ASE19_00210 [Nocardioides sp. Root79]KRC68675.1 hypothetical protein ASE20_17755 [Nocardioides sp. Root240]